MDAEVERAVPILHGKLNMITFFSGVIVPAIFVVVMLIGFGIITLAKRGLPWSKKRRSPFTSQFLRSPGQSVWKNFNELRTDLMGYLVGLIYVPIAFIGIPLIQSVVTGESRSIAAILVFIISGTVSFIYFVVKLYTLTQKTQMMRLGYEGELAVGQELNQLLAAGFRVFHDFPADGFNIDHIVVGRTGVFAVETKARGKPDSGNKMKDARLNFDGVKLQFPNWMEKKPLEQSKKQAVWLSRWLESAVGDSVVAVPVLAIPGWFINQTGRSDVLVYNGKRPEKVFPKYRSKSLTDQMIQRISHQLEAKCRDIDPRAYVDDNGSE